MRRGAGALLVVALGSGASACSSSSKTATDNTPAVNATTTSGLVGTSVPKGYEPGAGAPAAALAAVTAFVSKHGPPLGTWTITGMQVSRVDPTYLLFRVSPAQGHEADVQGGYGFAHNVNGKWTVTGYGTSEVGCPPGAPDNTPVPAPVIVGFSLTCPPAAG